jgi:hypothetical protein
MSNTKVISRFAFESNPHNGASFEVSGVRGEAAIDLTIEEPGTGPGLDPGGQTATVRVPLDEWNEIVALVARSTAPDMSASQR